MICRNRLSVYEHAFFYKQMRLLKLKGRRGGKFSDQEIWAVRTDH